MKYSWLVPKDQRHNNFILFNEADDSRPVSLRERYVDLRCPRCNKFDEVAALHRGLDAGIRVRARSDYVSCDYGLIAVSERFRQLLSKHNIAGVSYVPLPSDENYAVLLPHLLAETDLETCGLELHRQCDACGRYSETCFFPRIASMNLPDDENTILSSTALLEKVHTRTFWFLAAKPVVDILKQNKVSGVEYMEAY